MHIHACMRINVVMYINTCECTFTCPQTNSIAMTGEGARGQGLFWKRHRCSICNQESDLLKIAGSIHIEN